jgi:putative ABC transport system permease protein
MYLPYTQSPTAILHLLVRTAGDPIRLSEAIRREVAALDRDQPIFDVKSLQEVMDDSTTRSGVLTELLGGFAVIAVVLASLGIYGITACWTSRRSREIGIRIALGARPVQVIQLVTGQGLRPVIAGTVAGLIAAGAATRVLRSLLVGVTVTDALTFAIVAIALLLAAAAATYVPARQAARIAPMEALRHE